MTAIPYTHEWPYVHDGARIYPGFWLTLASLSGELEVEAVAALDSGAEISLFDGVLARMLGLDLMAGVPQRFVSTTGAAVEAYLHPVSIALRGGELELVLPVAFSTGPLLRNLLGRDFFYSFKIGFQERMAMVCLAAEPD